MSPALSLVLGWVMRQNMGTKDLHAPQARVRDSEALSNMEGLMNIIGDEEKIEGGGWIWLSGSACLLHS